MAEMFWATALPYLSFCAGMVMLCVAAPVYDKISRQRSERRSAVIRHELTHDDIFPRRGQEGS